MLPNIFIFTKDSSENPICYYHLTYHNFPNQLTLSKLYVISQLLGNNKIINGGEMIKRIRLWLIFFLPCSLCSCVVITEAMAANKVVVIPLQGKSAIELTRVSETYSLATYNATCHSHGNLPCYYGSTTISCPEGMGVLGGGVQGTSHARYGSISNSYPSSDTAWSCASSYDLSVNNVCWAICAPMK